MPENQTPSSAVSVARATLKLIGRLERLVCLIAFTILVIVLFADVISRETTSAGLHWASQVGVWANVFVVMAGFGLASSAGAHLRPRFLDKLLPRSCEAVLESLQHICMAIFCIAIAMVALSVVLDSWRLGEVELTLFMPVWPVQAMLPLAFFAAALRHLIYAAFPLLRPTESGAFDMGGASLPKSSLPNRDAP